jgi:general secretion pathway protein D
LATLIYSAIALCGCQSVEDGPVAEWRPAPLVHVDDGKTRSLGPSQGLGPDRQDKPERVTNIEGTGEFTGSLSGKVDVAGRPTEDGVILNLVNLPVAQAAKVVLGDILSSNYVVDPKLEGRVTLNTTNPVERSDVLGIFQAALRLDNATVVQSGGLFRVVGLDQAAALGAPLTPSIGDESAATMSSGVRIVQLKYVSASEIKRILDPISPKGGVVSADDARNTLTLNGAADEVSTMIDLVRVFDIDTMRGMSFGVVPVRTSEPEALADQVRTVFGADREGPMNGMVRFLPNKRLGSILVISPQPRYLTRAEEWIRRLDARAAGSEKQLYTYKVQNRPAKELLPILVSMFGAAVSNSGAADVAPRDVAATIATSPSAQQPTGAVVTPSGASTIGGAPAVGPQAALFGAMSAARAMGGNEAGGNFGAMGGGPSAGGQIGDDSRVKISLDDSNNALIVMASPPDYKRLAHMIQSLDVIPNQVLIEATIAEVTLNDDLQFGVRWYLQKKAAAATFTNDAGGALASVFPGFSYALKAANAQVTLNALNQITTVNVISTPSLMVLDNKTATLQVGDQVPIITQSATSVASAGAPVINSVSYQDTGVILSLTPRINESGRVLLDIEQQVSTVAATTSSSIDSPTIQQRRIKTTVVVNSSESLTLGGLIQNSKTLSRTQAPLLGDLPLIGAAFRSKDDTIAKTELIIIITPHIVRNLDEAQAVTDEYKRKLDIYVPRAAGEGKSLVHTLDRMLN